VIFTTLFLVNYEWADKLECFFMTDVIYDLNMFIIQATGVVVDQIKHVTAVIYGFL
jgi:hypothetical protein